MDLCHLDNGLGDVILLWGDQWHTTYAIAIHCRCVCLCSHAGWRFFYDREMNLINLCVQEPKFDSLERDVQTPSDYTIDRQDAQKMKNIPAYRL